MTLDLSSGWFRLEEERHRAYIERGRSRLAELDTQRRDIRTIAAEALAERSGQPQEDRRLLQRAVRDPDRLDPWERRRVEYLALKLTARAPAPPAPTAERRER